MTSPSDSIICTKNFATVLFASNLGYILWKQNKQTFHSYGVQDYIFCSFFSFCWCVTGWNAVIWQTICPSWVKRLWKSKKASRFIWTTDWTGDGTVKQHTRRNRADCTAWGCLGSFSVCSKMLHIFHKSISEGAKYSVIICWGRIIRGSSAC